MPPFLSPARAGLLLLLASAGFAAHAATGAREAWAERPAHSLDGAQVKPAVYRSVALDVDALRRFIDRDALRGTPLSLPTPEGDFADFVLEDAGTMAPQLAAQFPEIRSLRGSDALGNTVRVDVSPLGFQAMVFERNGGRWVVQPETLGNGTDAYLSFRRGAVARSDFQCAVHDESRVNRQPALPPQLNTNTGANLRNLRTVVAATGEYTAVFGGTVANGQAAVVVAVNRVNEVYERDFSVHMTLVANNSSMIFTNAISDPYTNDDGFAMLDENQAAVTTIIGAANYDIGHVFSTGGGGVAALDAICDSFSKAQGVTGLPNPVGDPFYIDYVAHEMGHQYGGDHTFNSNSGSCFGNRDASSAFETGSGSTIMAYAGICDANDLQPNSDAYFHARSLEQINNRLNATACGTVTANPNNAPVIPAFTGTPAAIPARTPFTLVAPVATDADGDTLSYVWEEIDLGASTNIGVDNGASPIIRSFSPTADRTRTVPRLSNLLANTTAPGEILPQTNRTGLKFRLTVRDNRVVGGKSVSADLPPIQVVNTGSPFAVTAPNTALTWGSGSAQSVTWDVAGTTAAPISCATVDIALSTDGGNTFPTTLSAATANDGSASVTVPAVITTTARVRVKCSNNIFFDVSNANFTIGAFTDNVFANGFE